MPRVIDSSDMSGWELFWSPVTSTVDAIGDWWDGDVPFFTPLPETIDWPDGGFAEFFLPVTATVDAVGDLVSGDLKLSPPPQVIEIQKRIAAAPKKFLILGLAVGAGMIYMMLRGK